VIRRIFVTAFGAVGGVALRVALAPPRFIGWRILLACAIGGSTLALAVFEKLRIIPTQEQVDKQQRPISIFSHDNEDRESRSHR